MRPEDLHSILSKVEGTTHNVMPPYLIYHNASVGSGAVAEWSHFEIDLGLIKIKSPRFTGVVYSSGCMWFALLAQRFESILGYHNL